MARASVSLASSMLSVALGWHIYQITGNPLDLALVGLVQILPVIFLFMVTGAVIDRFPRKIVLVACVLAQGLLLTLLALGMNQTPFDKNLVLLLLFLFACANAFYYPAQEAVLPNIVEVDFFPRAVSITAVVWNTAGMAGPFIGGLLIAWIDLNVYWVIAALCFIGGALFNTLPKLTHLPSKGRTLQQVVSGIHFVAKSPVVLGSISLDLFIVLLGSVVALLPIYAADILQVGPESLGLLRAMPALGAVVVGLLLARIPELRQVGRLLFFSLGVFVCSILVFAFSTHLWLSLLALFVYGGSDMVSVNVRQSLIQLATPNELRGRVSAVNGLFIACSNKLGDFRSGSVAALMSPVATVALGGLMAMGVVIAGYALFPKIRHLDRLKEASADKTN